MLHNFLCNFQINPHKATVKMHQTLSFPFANFNRKVYLNLSCPFSLVNAVGSGHVPTLSCFTVALEHVYLKLHRSLPGVDLACEESFRKGALVIKENT